jgi:hypothetical protein
MALMGSHERRTRVKGELGVARFAAAPAAIAEPFMPSTVANRSDTGLSPS